MSTKSFAVERRAQRIEEVLLEEAVTNAEARALDRRLSMQAANRAADAWLGLLAASEAMLNVLDVMTTADFETECERPQREALRAAVEAIRGLP